MKTKRKKQQSTLLAEGERIERSRRFRTGYGLASRPIATLATFLGG